MNDFCTSDKLRLLVMLASLLLFSIASGLVLPTRTDFHLAFIPWTKQTAHGNPAGRRLSFIFLVFNSMKIIYYPQHQKEKVVKKLRFMNENIAN